MPVYMYWRLKCKSCGKDLSQLSWDHELPVVCLWCRGGVTHTPMHGPAKDIEPAPQRAYKESDILADLEEMERADAQV